jgi:Kae1-associated kinase Bud32
MPREIIQRGAEAVLYIGEGGALFKERLRKGYRIPEIDEEIRKQRTKKEVGLLYRARRAGVPAPNAELTDKYIIRMDYIKGKKVKDVLNGMCRKEQDEVAEKIAGIAAAMHSANIIHGDLTTSNMILKDGEIHMIDFGLGKVSEKVEDQATDLFLLHEALLSTHFGIAERLWKKIINTYAQKYSNAREVMARLERIELRRRYK